jgi:TPR repeat protein
MYLNGAEKLPKDQHEAAKWFRKAAVQQNKASQDKLAAMLAQGLISPEEANWRTAQPTISQPPISQPSISQAPSRLPRPPKAVAGKTTPFSFAEVETGLTGGITSKRMTTLVQEFGVDFKLSPNTRKRLADEGADDNLLAAISSRRLL